MKLIVAVDEMGLVSLLEVDGASRGLQIGWWSVPISTAAILRASSRAGLLRVSIVRPVEKAVM